MPIPKPEFPRPDRERANWLNLNGTWDFALFDSAQAEAPFLKDRAGYDRRITVPFSWCCPASGVDVDAPGIGWYRRTVRFESAGRVFLCFGAVDYSAEVYVNGARAGVHQGGYAPFEIDVTALWTAGDNRIEVRAEDFRHETQTYGKQGYGEIQGIWQTVWLEARPEAYIDAFRIVARLSGAVEIELGVHAPDGAAVESAFGGVVARGAVSGGRARLSFDIPNIRAWSPDDPYLYEGTLTLRGPDGGIDAVSTYFGAREITRGPAPGRPFEWIYLNGKPIYLNGTLDQAFNPVGHFTYPSDEAMRDEAYRLKRLGLNMVRIHIKPEEPRKLYWMDKLGVLVMADMPCFWGPPNEVARAAYEREWPEIFARDFNHPSLFSWVMFNESWGLLTEQDGVRAYLAPTQAWVKDVYERAKALDPTRLIEDNSPCRYDHVDTDLNTWHFYINGYDKVRDHIRHVVQNTYPGSEFNFIGGARQSSAPLMNSECGMVWGVDESAGDSDIAWQYRYMLNEFRLHDPICGFVFTEFHDVVNEFNGYYRIDDADKDFGYQDFCRGMTVADLHAADFVAIDAPPCQTGWAGQSVSVPLVLSSMTDARHAEGACVRWELWHDSPDGRVHSAQGTLDIPRYTYGASPLGALQITLPNEDAVAVLSLYLTDRSGAVVSRNFITFDVRAPERAGVIPIDLSGASLDGFAPVWRAHGGQKLCLGGSGEARFTVPTPREGINGLRIIFEAGAKRVLAKDKGEAGEDQRDLGFMRGYRVDRGAFKNSYFMTDEDRFPSAVEVLVDGTSIAQRPIQNDWADARGVLSWHNQPDDRKLDEAGSYGELMCIEVPSRLIPAIMARGHLALTLRVSGGGGLALYGRHSGRYPVDLALWVR